MEASPGDLKKLGNIIHQIQKYQEKLNAGSLKDTFQYTPVKTFKLKIQDYDVEIWPSKTNRLALSIRVVGFWTGSILDPTPQELYDQIQTLINEYLVSQVMKA